MCSATRSGLYDQFLSISRSAGFHDSAIQVSFYRIRRAFTPPPSRRGSENQDSGHSDVQEITLVEQNHVIQNVSTATSRWWAFIAFIMSIMHFVVQCYQFSEEMFKKVKQITVMLVNVNQPSLRSSIKGEDRSKEGITQDRRDSQDFSIFVPSSCSVLYLLHVFSLCFASCHSINHYLNHLAWQPSQTQ